MPKRHYLFFPVRTLHASGRTIKEAPRLFSEVCKRLEAAEPLLLWLWRLGQSRAPRRNHARARFGSISSATFDSNPACHRSEAAKAIMAALSVHNQGSALLNSNPAPSHAWRNCRRNAPLQLTPPLTVTRSTEHFSAAAIVLRTKTSTTAC